MKTAKTAVAQVLEKLQPQQNTPQAGKLTRKRVCIDCNQEIETDNYELDFRCPNCWEKKAADRQDRQKQQHQAALKVKWDSLCPVAYQKTDPNLIPCKSGYNHALRWAICERGLMLHGPTGTGKSRTAWAVAKQQHFAGKSIRVINSSSAIRFAGMFSVSSKEANDWLEDMCRCDVLILDDAFKVKLTEAFEAALFAIVDRRTENCRPIIATMNDTHGSLAERMTGDRGEPFIRRLRESCDPVAFV